MPEASFEVHCLLTKSIHVRNLRWFRVFVYFVDRNNEVSTTLHVEALHEHTKSQLRIPMNFSRNQLIGGLILLIVIWMVILYRMLFSAA